MALDAIVYKKFRNAFQQRCYRLMIEAYQTSFKEKLIQLDWNENDISFELYEKIEANPLKVKYRIHLAPEFRIQKDVPKIKGFADKLPRIDLKMAHYAREKEFKYFFEAKNLKQNDSALKRRYIDTGINSFLSGKYENGSLIGYLLEGNVRETIIGINSLLEKDKRHSETLKIKANSLLETCYESRHSEIETLKHLIFDFT